MDKKVILVTSLFRYFLNFVHFYVKIEAVCTSFKVQAVCVFENRNWCGSPDCQEKLEEWHAYPIVKIRVNNALIWTNLKRRRKKICVYIVR